MTHSQRTFSFHTHTQTHQQNVEETMYGHLRSSESLVSEYCISTCCNNECCDANFYSYTLGHLRLALIKHVFYVGAGAFFDSCLDSWKSLSGHACIYWVCVTRGRRVILYAGHFSTCSIKTVWSHCNKSIGKEYSCITVHGIYLTLVTCTTRDALGR